MADGSGFWVDNIIPKKTAESSRSELAAFRARTGCIARRTLQVLKSQVPIGERNTTFFMVAKDLYLAGYSAEDVFSEITTSRTYAGSTLSSEVARDLRGCISSAIKSVDTGKAYNVWNTSE
jgi:hypothetical protein